jgi:hypothetical protein
MTRTKLVCEKPPPIRNRYQGRNSTPYVTRRKRTHSGARQDAMSMNFSMRRLNGGLTDICASTVRRCNIPVSSAPCQML